MLERLAALAPHGSFWRNVSVLMGGTIFAHTMAMIALPALTRLYSPEDFNFLAVYSAILGIITAVSCLRYNIAIPLPVDDVDGLALFLVSVAAAFLTSLICLLLVVFLPESLANLLGQPGWLPYLWMIPIGVLVASIYNALQYWATRKKNFGLVARTRVTRSIGGIGAQLGFGLYAPSPFGLIFGHMIYGGLGILGLALNLFREDLKVLRNVTIKRACTQAFQHRNFPIYSVPETLFNTAGAQLPIILIAAIVADTDAGFLMLAMTVMGAPMTLIGHSVAQVFLSEAPEHYRNRTLDEFTKKTMWKLFKAGAPLILATGVVSPILFPLVFGEEWGRAGYLVAWMTPWFLLQFIASPIYIVFHVSRSQMVALKLQIFGFVLRVGVVVFTGYLTTEIVAEAYALSGALFYGCCLWAVTKKSNYEN